MSGPPDEALGALRGARVLLGVSGGIACYKAVELLRLMTKAGATVQVVMTESATRFVGTVTFAALSKRPVHTSVFEDEHAVLHVRLAREADVVVVAPATANVLAKAAGGIADDLLTNVLLTARCPVVLAPAMHTEMWENAATRRNVEALRERGAAVVDPEEGELAGGDEGVGRLAEPRRIAEAVAEALGRAGDLAGRRFIVTAGGTREPIDPIRFIGNRSSGKMGYAVAAEAARRGAAVTLVSGPSALPVPPRVEHVPVETAAQMRDAVLARFADADVVVKAAAVGDFRPVDPAGSKIKKEAGPPAVALEPTDDILAALGKARTTQLLVGFKAETDDAVPRGRKMLEEKGLDMVVVNRVGETGTGFDADDNEAVIISAGGEESHLPRQPKTALAREIIDRVGAALRSRPI